MKSELTERVAVYMTPQDKAVLDKAAARKSLPVSIYLRMVGVAAARQEAAK